MSSSPVEFDDFEPGTTTVPEGRFSFAPGNRFDRFEIVECYRDGAFKEVYLARDTASSNGERFALKVVKSLERLLDITTRSPSATVTYNLGTLREKVGDVRVRREKYEQETRVVRERLAGCPSVAQIVHQGVINLPGMDYRDEILYFVEEFIDGETLAEFLTREAPLSSDRALKLLKKLACAIQPIHAQSVAHRDVKGSNILIVPRGTDGSEIERVALTDFGNSAVLGSRYTQSGSILYRAPEQVQGKNGGQKSDMWALGLLVYEALNGKYPFATLRPDWSALTPEDVKQEKAYLKDQIAHARVPLPIPHPENALDEHLNHLLVGKPNQHGRFTYREKRLDRYAQPNQHCLFDRRRERRVSSNELVERVYALEHVYLS